MLSLRLQSREVFYSSSTFLLSWNETKTISKNGKRLGLLTLSGPGDCYGRKSIILSKLQMLYIWIQKCMCLDMTCDIFIARFPKNYYRATYCDNCDMLRIGREWFLIFDIYNFSLLCIPPVKVCQLTFCSDICNKSHRVSESTLYERLRIF